MTQTIRVKEEISPDLMLRGVADAFFDKLESIKADSLVLDFAGVESISRSFAHQYILRKRTSTKTINEINVPENVSKMLALVRRSSPRGKSRSLLADIDKEVITI